MLKTKDSYFLKLLVQCLASYLGDPGKFSMFFLQFFRLKVSKFRKQIMVSRRLSKNKPNSLSWKITTSRLIQKESLFARRYCINLEVVIFQDSELGLFFERSFETIKCFRNLLTFSLKNCNWFCSVLLNTGT